ncbi:hypothetical protein HPB49_007027 [Dermacentor silvarum]|uniref:Uncharacterized protein n=1 Tax=Dermacentor silvarum TaxID=543639 RepID=A0ACB8CVZ5_DERSI|nr:hypothetical protein HPB49_007027 [Dermacentor silvarum]
MTDQNPFGHAEREPALTTTTVPSPRRSCMMPANSMPASRPHPGLVNHPTDPPGNSQLETRTTKPQPTPLHLQTPPNAQSNIPDYDTAVDITKSFIYNNNPTILQARRMGNTNSVIILGPKIPFYVYYRGAEYRCYLHKKNVEVCGACGRIGHRAYVCPTPDKKQCKDCGAQHPADNHNCNPKCALCGKVHPTGDKSCQRRFQTPFLIKQRQWEKQRQQQTLHNHSGGGRDPSLPWQDAKQTMAAQRPSRLKLRDTATDRKASRSRSPSGHRPQAKQESKKDLNQ